MGSPMIDRFSSSPARHLGTASRIALVVMLSVPLDARGEEAPALLSPESPPTSPADSDAHHPPLEQASPTTSAPPTIAVPQHPRKAMVPPIPEVSTCSTVDVPEVGPLTTLPTTITAISALVLPIALAGLLAGSAVVPLLSIQVINGDEPSGFEYSLPSNIAVLGMLMAIVDVPVVIGIVSLLSVATLEHAAWLGTTGWKALHSRQWVPWALAAVASPMAAIPALLAFVPLHGVIAALAWARLDSMSPFQHGTPPDQRRWDFWTRHPSHRWKSFLDASVFSLLFTSPFLVPLMAGGLGLGWLASLGLRYGTYHASEETLNLMQGDKNCAPGKPQANPNPVQEG